MICEASGRGNRGQAPIFALHEGQGVVVSEGVY